MRFYFVLPYLLRSSDFSSSSEQTIHLVDFSIITSNLCGFEHVTEYSPGNSILPFEMRVFMMLSADTLIILQVVSVSLCWRIIFSARLSICGIYMSKVRMISAAFGVLRYEK